MIMSAKETIKVSEEVYKMIEELRTQFGQMTNNPDLTDEDVISVLISGFIESIEHDHQHAEGGECCGGGCDKEKCDKEGCDC
jgi:FKBP-type peptidyl-prolyl cis-trans isomerase (trigger factor)